MTHPLPLHPNSPSLATTTQVITATMVSGSDEYKPEGDAPTNDDCGVRPGQGAPARAPRA